MPTRVRKFESGAKPRKSPTGSYAPRQEARNVLKFKANDELKEQVEAEAVHYGLSVSHYLQMAIRTLIRENYPVKLQRED